MVEPSPTLPFIVAKPDLLLELLVIALDAPTQLGQIDEAIESNVLGKGGNPVFRWLGRIGWPLDQQPFFRTRRGRQIVAMSGAHPHPGESRGQPIGRPFAPSDRLPGAFRQAESQHLSLPRLPTRSISAPNAELRIAQLYHIMSENQKLAQNV